MSSASDVFGSQLEGFVLVLIAPPNTGAKQIQISRRSPQDEQVTIPDAADKFQSERNHSSQPRHQGKPAQIHTRPQVFSVFKDS